MYSRWFALGAAVVVLLIAGPATQAQEIEAPVTTGEAAESPTPDGPRLEVSPKDFDFGEVWEGGKATGQITVRNTGTAPLTIRTKSSCGCTVATSPKSPLPAGESSTFTITYNTSHPGKANKTVTLFTNDSLQPQVMVRVIGEVKQLYERRPIVISNAEVDTVASESVRLTNNYPKPLPLKLKADRDLGVFEAELKEITPGQEYELTARTKPPLKPGRSYTKIVLETGLEDAPEVSVVANVFVPLRAELSPSTLVISPSQRTPLTQTVRLQYRTDQPLKILEVKTTPPSIQCEISPFHAPAAGAKTASYLLKLTFPPLEEVPDQGAKLEVVTDDPSPEFQRMEVKIVKRAARSTMGPRSKSTMPIDKTGGKSPNIGDREDKGEAENAGDSAEQGETPKNE